MAGGLVLVSFELFPDNHKMPDTFPLGNVAFENRGTAGSLFVKEALGRRGLQFQKDGVRGTLPSGVDSVLFTAGGFAGPVKVEAKDRTGTVLFSRTLAPANQYISTLVHAPGMTHIELTGGGNEGVLVEIVVPC